MNPVDRGAVLIDKPKGMTSFDVVEKAREILGVKKAGHAGTLDPNVTGLMLIALGESRKAMSVLMGLDKEYAGKMLIHRKTGEEKIKKVFKKFIGEIVQKPPVRSRVARVERKRKIYSLVIIRIEDREIEFKVSCEAGTYIRKLIHDIGQDIGCGAHMTELRRTKLGPFKLKESVNLSNLSEKNIIKLENILKRTKLKRVFVKDQATSKIRNGSPVIPEWMIKRDTMNENEIVGIYDKSGKIIALGRPSGKKIKTDRVFN